MNDLPNLVESEHLITDLNFQFQVARLGQLAIKSNDLTKFMDIVVNTVATTLNVEYCKILELLPGEEELLLISGIGWHEGIVGHACVKAKEKSQAGFTLQTEKPVIVHDLNNEHRFSGPELLTSHNVVSGISVIIQGRTKHFGVLGAHTKVKRNFDANHANFLLSVSYILANAIEHQRDIEAIKSREKEYYSLIENASDAIFISDENRKFIYVNSKASEITGFSKEEFLSMSIEEIISKEEIERQPIIMDGIQLGENIVADRYLKRKDGSVVTVEMNLKKISPTRFQAICRDTTQRKIVTDKLIKESKFNTFTHLAGGIAHDFNNLLNVILGNISLAQLLDNDNNELTEIINNILLATKRAANITQQLTTFSQEYKPVIDIVNIENLVHEVINFTFYGSKTKPNITTTSNKQFLIEADEGQISQVLQNILINADQAIIKEHRIISIIIDRIDNYILNGNEQRPYLTISIEDNGTGISPENMEHIFDPFFTTKVNGKGLGLATSYSIIKNHHGSITINSEVDVGTKVTIFLPIYLGSKVPVVKSEDKFVNDKKLPGTVLVLDDDDLVRKTLANMLITLGLKVIVTSDGSDTVAIYQKKFRNKQRIDYVILDLTVSGGLGGFETLNKLKEIDPEVNSIVSSGYSKDQHLQNFKTDGFNAKLSKPYTLEKLFKALLESKNKDNN